MTGIHVNVTDAYEAFTENRFYPYRGCAPDVDRPDRMAGDPGLPLGAHQAPDVDGGEPQTVRRAREAAALEVCLNCPVMVACDRYASSVRADGRLAEPDGIWGGRTALERHRALIQSRQAVAPAPDRRFQTWQKRAVLKAFAAVWEPFEVARVAGVDVRTANWQRSNLVTLLGLPRSASRARLLAAAGERGLLVGVVVVADDGSVPAVAPPTKIPAPASAPTPEVVPAVPVAGPETAAAPIARQTLSAAPSPRPEAPAPPDVDVALHGPVRVPAPRRDRFTDIEGQLALWEAELVELAPVHHLFPATPLEAAA